MDVRTRGGAWLLAAWLLAAPAAATLDRHVQLADPAVAATEADRDRLKYLVSCALPAGVVVDADAGGAHYEYGGDLGLAPAWSQRALTRAEAHWVSACILARTNFYGRKVEISLRAIAAASKSLEADAGEQARFPRHEAAFFGDIFQSGAPAYVCNGSSAAQDMNALRAHLRICSLPDGRRLADGRPLSYCGFIVVGACATQPYVQDGVDYSHEAIRVYLPAAPTRAG